MKIITARTLIFLIILYGANVVHASPLTTNTLYKACEGKRNSEEFSFCLGFIAGVANSALPATQAAMFALGGESDNATIMKAAIASGRVFGCGENYKINDTVRHFVEFVDKNPDVRNNPAVFTLTHMMANKYICK
ncbi:hypothetical protein NMYAN_30029 [Nitrosomonas nitrosa]|uniref:Rap1a immunity protein domain-containing protein n=1 Tax=Nitrosomonas nitrosa TaxID=52442 RepID=A0A8H9DAC8_9PROT|nr:Rap1a/Tai family immunity protein [Nitrosomonas nitrosa]CAE6508537.1 hypothetical protein NMYAN_30029 [Nitrosomonas nitrosa]